MSKSPTLDDSRFFEIDVRAANKQIIWFDNFLKFSNKSTLTFRRYQRSKNRALKTHNV